MYFAMLESLKVPQIEFGRFKCVVLLSKTLCVTLVMTAPSHSRVLIQNNLIDIAVKNPNGLSTSIL